MHKTSRILAQMMLPVEKTESDEFTAAGAARNAASMKTNVHRSGRHAAREFVREPDCGGLRLHVGKLDRSLGDREGISAGDLAGAAVSASRVGVRT
jgi:hypothetical protein